MSVLDVARRPLVGAGVVTAAAASGMLLARSQTLGMLLLASVVFALFVVVVADAPIAGFFIVAVALGVAPELEQDSRLFRLTASVYDPVAFSVSPLLFAVGFIAVVLAFTADRRPPWWPGLPATLAVAMLVIALANVAWFSPLQHGLLIVRPLVFLVLAVLVGYWTSLRYGVKLPLVALVVAGALAIPGGFYNSSLGQLSYYDASMIYLIGMAAIVVYFRVVDIGVARLPFCLLAVVVIGLSTRRGATITVAVAFLIAALFYSRGHLRTVLAVGATAVIVAELVVPNAAVSRAEELAGFYSGSSGERAVYAREWESDNAWLNIRDHWLFGIGPTANWALIDTAGGNFVPAPDLRQYLHNSYQWVWLRYGLIGLLTFIAFLGVSAFRLIGRSLPSISVIVGGSIAGLAVGLVTGSWLTTTTRWPLSVGLYLGIALAAVYQSRSASASTIFGTTHP